VLAMPAQRELLAQRIRAMRLLPERLKQAALGALERLPAGGALCHGDFHPGNLLLARNGPVVIDWENATSGDPAADVARTLLLLRYAHFSQSRGVARAAMRAAVALFGVAYLQHYRRLTGVSPAQIAAWQLPVAAVRLSEGVAAEEERALLRSVAHLC
ncbi:MAG: aminoglycoside phosphotransferase family protein, partial [Chloroflexales bacterium]|nr:aminoglycoside phosphotransferase family protein [Chloroflexales bacterium]